MSVKKYLYLIFVSTFFSLSTIYSIVAFTDPTSSLGTLFKVMFFVSLFIFTSSVFSLIFYFFGKQRAVPQKQKYFQQLENSLKQGFILGISITVFMILKMQKLFPTPILIIVFAVLITFLEIVFRLKLKKKLKIDRNSFQIKS